MDQKTANSIQKSTEELHKDITIIYEHLMDGEDRDAIRQIDRTITKMRHLKSNITFKDEI